MGIDSEVFWDEKSIETTFEALNSNTVEIMPFSAVSGYLHIIDDVLMDRGEVVVASGSKIQNNMRILISCAFVLISALGRF
jgi:hypothetical protein